MQKKRGVLARPAVSCTALPASALRQWPPTRYLREGGQKFYNYFIFLEISMEFKMSENVLVFEHMHSKFTKSANIIPIFFSSTKSRKPNSLKWA